MSGLYTLDFSRISHADFARVGGKCASLGEMTQAGVAVPPGFAVTTDAYAAMLDHHGLVELEGVVPLLAAVEQAIASQN